MGLFYVYGVQINLDKVLELIEEHFDLTDEEKEMIQKYRQIDKTIHYTKYSKDENKIREYIDDLLVEYTHPSEGTEISIEAEFGTVELLLANFPHDHNTTEGYEGFTEEYYLGVRLTDSLKVGVCNYSIDHVNDIVPYKDLGAIDVALEKVTGKQSQLMVVATDCGCCS
jgi:hypothetical protein